jgi:hypothetical protein
MIVEAKTHLALGDIYDQRTFHQWIIVILLLKTIFKVNVQNGSEGNFVLDEIETGCCNRGYGWIREIISSNNKYILIR